MWKTLEDIDQRLAALRNLAGRRARPRRATGRELMTVLFQEVSFQEDDLSEQRQTYYNGDGDDIIIQRFAATVSFVRPIEPGVRTSLYKVTGGWSTYLWDASLPGIGSEPGFDFQWNYVVNSRQSQYSRDPCMSDMLVGLDKGQMLDFRVPLVLPKSESLEFRVQPLRYLFPDHFAKLAHTYFVGFIGLGYRSVP